MNASFEEKSVWIQLLSIVVMLGSYLVIAAPMLANDVTALPPFVPLFIAAVVLMVVMLIAGHIVVAIHSRPEGRDERDQLIEWRAESNSGWVLAVGVLAAVAGLIMSVDNVWIAHVLVLSLFLSTVVRYVLQLVYYRRGV